jgi:serpin B
MRNAAIIGILITVLLLGCAKDAIQADDSGATKEGIASVVTDNNGFALDMYAKLSDGSGNVFFSPWSISAAFAMTYEGARGRTAEEMRQVLHFTADDLVRRSSFASLYNKLNPQGAKYQLSTANALWAQKDYPFLAEYQDTVLNYYAGRVTNLDFIKETEASRQIINTWVEEQTNNKIEDLLPPDSLNAMTRLVLTNAVYFKGDWVKGFKKSETKDQNFRTPTGAVKVPMMSRTDKDSRFGYFENDDLQVLEMPYKGDKISMLVLLPKSDSLQGLETSLTAENLQLWSASARENNERVSVFFPRFKFETKYSLVPIFEEMGMPTPFSMEADFSGMDGTKLLYISVVFHQAYVDVDEKGTEAAAATAVVMTLNGIPSGPLTFRADHPFIFIIQDRDTGSILFMGRVEDPSK